MTEKRGRGKARNPVEIVVVGLGARGSWALGEFVRSKRYTVRGLCDRIPARMAFMAERCRIPQVPRFTDYAECLRRCDFEAVFVGSHDGSHAQLAVPSLRAGKYVYLEKPLEVTWSGCRAIIAADRRAGGRTFVGHNLRFSPLYTAIQRGVRDGRIGAPLTIEYNEFYDAGRTYFRRWNRLREYGGGLWITKACHDFDLLCWIAGAAPKSVYAVNALSYYRPRRGAARYCRDCRLRAGCPDAYEHFEPRGSLNWELYRTTEESTGEKPDLCLYNAEKDTFDHGAVLLRFPGGLTATYTLNVVAGFATRQMRVAGPKGALESDEENLRLAFRPRDGGEAETIDLSSVSRGGHGGADEKIFEAFARFVRGGTPTVHVRPKEAALAVRVGLAATRSADEERIVRLAEIR